MGIALAFIIIPYQILTSWILFRLMINNYLILVGLLMLLLVSYQGKINPLLKTLSPGHKKSGFFKAASLVSVSDEPYR